MKYIIIKCPKVKDYLLLFSQNELLYFVFCSIHFRKGASATSARRTGVAGIIRFLFGKQGHQNKNESDQNDQCGDYGLHHDVEYNTMQMYFIVLESEIMINNENFSIYTHKIGWLRVFIFIFGIHFQALFV